MKKIALLLLVVALSSHGLSQTGKWENLFNGKNLDGWVKLNGTADYKIAGNTIVGVSKTGTPNTFLTTAKHYDDFILEFDFRVDDGLNSGVQFRSLSNKEYQNGRVHGYQFEIDPSARQWTGGIYDEARRGWLYPMNLNPAGQAAFRKDDWNTARIEAIGNSIRTWVNGVLCADLLDDMTKSGFIALQVHSIGNKSLEGKTVSWRNIRIQTEGFVPYDIPRDMQVKQVNAIANTLSEREKNEGWSLLWNGRTPEGWRSARSQNFPERGWVIENGVLKVLKSEGKESANGGDIITSKRYKNFILSVDFKITEGANSGIKYFVNPDLNKASGSAIGCEFQILDDEKHPDAKLGVKGNRTLGSLYDLIPAPDDKPFRRGFFNTAMVIVNGDHVEHWLNGVKIIEYERRNQQWDALVNYSKFASWPGFGNAEDGHILLQDHGDEVWFQNIKIKELP